MLKIYHRKISKYYLDILKNASVFHFFNYKNAPISRCVKTIVFVITSFKRFVIKMEF